MVEINADQATVLLVDDDQDALHLLGMVMERADYITYKATTGEEAIEILEKHASEIETVVLDLMMPGKYDGYGICSWLQSNARTKQLPIIVLSAKSSTIDRTRSFAAGAAQHITKPYDIHYLMAVVRSMVRMSRLERSSTQHAEKYQAIVDNSPLEMLLLSSDLHIIEMNRTFRDRFPTARVADDPFATVYSESNDIGEEHPTRKARRTGVAQDGIVKGVSKGRNVYRKVHSSPLRDGDGNVTALVEITEDVTKSYELEESLRRQIERHNRALHQQDLMAEHLMNIQRQLKQKNQELEDARILLERLSITDDLTQLFNKRYLETALTQEVRRSCRYSHPLSLVMLDIDHFKRVNDTYGHPSGDVVLSEIGAILKVQLRETDTIVRYGGEEFLAILPETDRPTAERIGERLREAVEARRFTLVDGTVIQITISVGTASVCSKTIDAEALIHAADDALYKAKRNGRNCVSSCDLDPKLASKG